MLFRKFFEVFQSRIEIHSKKMKSIIFLQKFLKLITLEMNFGLVSKLEIFKKFGSFQSSVLEVRFDSSRHLKVRFEFEFEKSGFEYISKVESNF